MHPLAGERRERCVVDHHREVENSAQAARARGVLGHQPRDIFRGTDVGPDHLDLDAFRGETLRRKLPLPAWRRRSGCERTRWRAPPVDEPVGEHFAKAAKSAGNEIAAIGPDRETGRERLARGGGTKASGKETTTLPMCLPPAMRRKAASTRLAGNERNGSGESAPASTSSAISPSMPRVSASSPLKTASMATTWKEALFRSGQSGMREFW